MAHDDTERSIGKELEDLRILKEEFKHLLHEAKMATQKTIDDLKAAAAAQDQAQSRLVAATEKLISIISSTPAPVPDDEADVSGVVGEINSVTAALNAQAQRAEDAAAAAASGGTKPPTEVPAPTLTSNIDPTGVATVTAAVDDTKATSVKFASNATAYPDKATVEAAPALTSPPFVFTPAESPIPAGGSSFVSAIAYAPDGTGSEVAQTTVSNSSQDATATAQASAQRAGGPQIVKQ